MKGRYKNKTDAEYCRERAAKRREYMKRWHAEHKDWMRSYYRKYFRKRRNKVLKAEIDKRYYEKHRDFVRSYTKAYHIYIRRPLRHQRNVEAKMASLGFNIFALPCFEKPIWAQRENAYHIMSRFMELS